MSFENPDRMNNQEPPIMDAVYERARAANALIVLPESEDPRIAEAAQLIQDQGLARLLLLNNQSLSSYSEAETREIAESVIEARRARGEDMSIEAATQLLASDPKYLGAALVRSGKADGYVAGNISSTEDSLRPALKIIGSAENYASSYFIMMFKDRTMFFADCGFNREPSAEELATIAVDTARSVATYGIEPRVAFLSFSTKESAKHARVDKVRAAIAMAREKAPDIAISEDELQFDAAVDPEVALRKAPGSRVAGNANVLVFPDLDSGNIGYKIAHRMAGARPIGPIMQGLNAPANDLSRGCSVQEIVDVVAVTAMQAGAMRERN